MPNVEADVPSSVRAGPPGAGIRTPGAPSPVLEHARRGAGRDDLSYAGNVSPREAWELFSRGEAVLVDVRTTEERRFVGHVPGSQHVAWATGLSLARNPRFTDDLEEAAGKEAVILLLCRSGKRSVAAAEAATRAGFRNVFNILEGFEGDLDVHNRRGATNGWRHAGLPWLQD